MSSDNLTLIEAGKIKSMTQTEGWKVLSREMKERFNIQYGKLRKTNRDSAFYKIQGYLNAIEEIFNIVEQKMLDVEEE